jgi:hypothetical protein
MAALWLAEIDASDLAFGTERLYRFVIDAYVLPALGELRLRAVTVPAVDGMLTSVQSNHGTGAAKSARCVLSGILRTRRGGSAGGPLVGHRALRARPLASAPGRHPGAVDAPGSLVQRPDAWRMVSRGRSRRAAPAPTRGRS